MIRLPRPAIAVLAGLVVVMASGCSSASVTPRTGGSGGGGSNSSDPNAIITSVINGGSTIKSFHIQIAVSGTIKKEALASEAASSGLRITSDVKLDGTAIEGDVDVANQAAHLTLNVPAMAMLGGIPITGDFILVDKALYYKVSLLGANYTKTDLGSLTDGLPVSIPSVGPSATSVTDEITQIRTSMQQAGVTATLVGTDQIGGKDAYHINFSVPLDKLNAQIAAASSGAPSAALDSASVDFWVYKADSRPAKLEIKGASASLGNLDFTVTITNYDAAVTVAAPSADQINP